MSEQSVIITGASRGIGRATALALAQMGAALTINARSAEALAQVQKEIEAAGGRATMLAADISDPDAAASLVQRAVDAFGGVDVVINNAGVLEPVARIAQADPAQWLRNFEVNIWAPFLLTQAALPHLRRSPHARVINVSSGVVNKAIAGWSAYSASKAALNKFNEILAVEEPEIMTLAVRPGSVDTAMQGTLRAQGGDVMPPEVYQRFMALYASGGLLPPEAPAHALAALALRAPRAWSGRFISWNDSEVLALI